MSLSVCALFRSLDLCLRISPVSRLCCDSSPSSVSLPSISNDSSLAILSLDEAPRSSALDLALFNYFSLSLAFAAILVHLQRFILAILSLDEAPHATADTSKFL
jgi:hypothetical protein